ncbi:hypothetical protein LI328DRAFT_160071 [Trichoderma asperelloides]|nr:hypothetical protein LI328DRAFT_160071 [Trichoderma asperelloides]
MDRVSVFPIFPSFLWAGSRNIESKTPDHRSVVRPEISHENCCASAWILFSSEFQSVIHCPSTRLFVLPFFFVACTSAGCLVSVGRALILFYSFSWPLQVRKRAALGTNLLHYSLELRSAIPAWWLIAAH